MEKLVIHSPRIHKLQVRHFIAFGVTPLVTVLAFPFYYKYIITGWFEIALFVGLWLVTGLGIVVGYHRLFTHRAFKCGPGTQGALAITGAMAGQGPVTSWVAMHRLHHEHSDCTEDLHSPNLHGRGAWNRLRGLAHAHFLWMSNHPYPNVIRYAPDMIRNTLISKINGHYYTWVVLGLLLPTVLGALYHQSLKGAISGFLWGGIFRIFFVENMIWFSNSVLHSFGSRAYETRENSRNAALMSIFSLGESWHNNHHRFPSSPNVGLRWYQLDPGYWLIKLLAISGLAWDLRLPDRTQIEDKRHSSHKAQDPLNPRLN